MVDQTTERTIIAAAPDACYAAAIDFERYPEWASDVKMARILSRDDDGRAVDVEFRAAAMGRSTTYTLRYFYGANPDASPGGSRRAISPVVSTVSTSSCRWPRIRRRVRSCTTSPSICRCRCPAS